jgi:hypothetical protein
LRGVLNVEGNVVDMGAWTAQERARNEIEGRLLDALRRERS